jgi:hypothetical protein
LHIWIWLYCLAAAVNGCTQLAFMDKIFRIRDENSSSKAELTTMRWKFLIMDSLIMKKPAETGESR